MSDAHQSTEWCMGANTVAKSKLNALEQKKEDHGMSHPLDLHSGHCDSSRFLTGKKVSCIWFIALL